MLVFINIMILLLILIIFIQSALSINFVIVKRNISIPNDSQYISNVEIVR